MKIAVQAGLSMDIPGTDDRLFDGALRLLQLEGGHRAGTDAVLLAAATPPDAQRIADLGAATGVVGLRAAQLNPAASVILVEREPVLVDLARRNIARNGLEDRVSAIVDDVLALSRRPDLREAFDLVLTNPPFLDAGSARISPKEGRASAHVMDAPLDDWVRNAVAVLAPKGRLLMIHRADVLESAVAAFSKRLGGIGIRFIHARPDTPATRLLISGRKGSRAPLAILPPLFLHDRDGRFLPEADALHVGKARL